MARRIIYFGASLTGKSTNLQVLSTALPRASAAPALRAVPKQNEEALVLDLAIQSTRGEDLHYELMTLPGAVFYEVAWTEVFRGADGFIYVADSRREAFDENEYYLRRFDAHLKAAKLHRSSCAVVIQANKRDLPSAAPLDAIEKNLGEHVVPATALDGKGVVETLRALLERMVPGDAARIDWSAFDPQSIR